MDSVKSPSSNLDVEPQDPPRATPVDGAAKASRPSQGFKQRAAFEPGLCADCVHAQQVMSARESNFLLCRLSFTDPRFPKYPRLPVLSCLGYQAAPQADR